MTDTTPPEACPFCGAQIEIANWEGNWGFAHPAQPERCIMEGDFYDYSTEAEALTAWNTRANADARLVEALRDCVAVLTDPIVGTIYHDDPDWYQALDRAVAKARAALSEVSQ